PCPARADDIACRARARHRRSRPPHSDPRCPYGDTDRPRGVGKTRLAVAVGERLADSFRAGSVFVSLETITEPELVMGAIGRAVGADLGTASPRQAVMERLGDGAWLLILDNLEQALEV